MRLQLLWSGSALVVGFPIWQHFHKVVQKVKIASINKSQ